LIVRQHIWREISKVNVLYRKKEVIDAKSRVWCYFTVVTQF